MIAAVSGIVLSRAAAVHVLDAIDKQERLLAQQREPNGRPAPESLPTNLLLLRINLRRALAKTGDSQRNIARSGASNARSMVFQADSAQDAVCATLSSAEVAAVLGITPNAVRDLRRRGSLHAERVGGRYRFDAAEVEARATSNKE
ncbi:helix-turn-helix domain-containing protein [Mycobacterium marinum]|uniref:helix-turn-helix domain-containing protein n=1 Tax=Mycobacterium marinum TaxID=1781 RepID=UPI0023583762|nr:helix-turn-helix domain-containing protein [Mycobacterium marinum]MDC9006471.1 helix-turn-helix domain-containing protein [Mycobacterium marinum]